MKQLMLIFPNSSNPLNNLEAFFSTVKNIDTDKYLFCNGPFPDDRLLEVNGCRACPKIGDDKTEMVMNAFLKGFLKDYKKILWLDLNHLSFSEELIKRVLWDLDTCDVVLEGDEETGLLGMTNFYSQIFEQEIGTKQIIKSLSSHEISYRRTCDPVHYFSRS